nr:oxysterol-binding protein-related protein 3-like isoform X2 [Physcomitrium patens]|eukprot:XP_024360842.1 oxysterol-binding protein-related protein 3-like isoform X2 [Physcomitrella patens]
MRGSMVYYLRTINRDYRQPWLDAIYESIRVYRDSAQTAQGGGYYGTALLPQPSVPSHAREDWEIQEKELKRRVRERLRDLEPTRKAFLDQLQTLQQSLSTISGVLGFADHGEVPQNSTTNGFPTLPRLQETNWRSNGLFITENEVSNLDVSRQQNGTPSTGDDKLSSPDMGASNSFQNHSGPTSPRMNQYHENEPYSRSGLRSLVKFKSDSEALMPKKSTKDINGSRSHKSMPVSDVTADEKFGKGRRRSLSLSVFEHLEDDTESFSQDVSCIGAECFPVRKRIVHGNASDTESGSRKPLKFSGPLHHQKKNGDSVYNFTPSSSQELDPNLMKKLEKEVFVPNKENEMSSGSASRSGGGSNHGSKEVRFGAAQLRAVDKEGSGGPGRNGLFSQGPLHAAWNHMQDMYTEVLKEEIYRVLELEAENAVLQQAMRSLPQLQQDRAALLSLKERHKKQCECGRKLTSEEEVEEYGEDTEEEIAIVHPDVGNEEYFEALEVLNHHEFASRSISPDEQGILGEPADGNQEPPEEAETGDADFLSEAEGEEIDQPRRRLPAPRPLSRGFTVWTVLKNAVGRDLNHITMPATINEPLSVLQKCAEELQYRHLLEQAVQKKGSLERLLLASAFTCASYYGSIHRDAKPFNPLLGETYEYQDYHCWFLAEQVSHHPPILAFQSEDTGGRYQIYGEIEIKNKFWGRSIEVLCNGAVHLKIPKYGDHITWNRATLCIHNVLVGKAWIDNYGEVSVVNHSTGDVGRIRFHKATSREQCRITGKIYDSKGVPHYTIFGNYMEAIYSCPDSCTNFDVNGPDVRMLWKAPEQIEDYRQQYCFTRYALALNELTPKLSYGLPPTDSRFRPDQRALEDGDLEKATPEKLRLEDKQRIARRVRKEQGIEWQNMWFTQRESGVSEVKTIEEGNAEPSWVYKGTYWDAREKQNWEGCPDIM